MIPKSIKWRLQIWYGLILVVVLAGFGFTAYHLESNRQFRRIDDELHRRVGVLANALRRPPPRGPDTGEPLLDRPPPDQMPENLPRRNQRPPIEFHLPPQAVGLFDASDPNGFYFVITRDGNEIARSTNAPDQNRLVAEPIKGSIVEVNTMGTPPYLQKRDPRVKYNGDITVDADFRSQRIPVGQPGPVWMHGTFREVTTPMPSGEEILVGKNVVPELKELRFIALSLTGVGGGILLLGLMVGARLVSRAIKPIEDISATAVKISAGDLSQRINVAEAESELGQLASVLNSTFARLDAAFAQQKQFASDAAHELRTPVSVMLTQTQTALNRERTAPEYRETVEVCQSAAQRMRKLIGALLELARLDAGQEQMKRQCFDFSTTVADCVELVKPLAEESGVKIFTELSPLEISGDSERLAQVATNLLTNAIQYNKPGGEVRIKLASQGSLAILTVSDTGNGISREDLPHVFRRFYRGDKSRTGGNTGLGLAIAKAIAEAHGGTIEVSSEEGTGSAFTVRLPV
jgi:signal transduction histidine kinase